MSWTRLIRFQDEDGHEHYGQPTTDGDVGQAMAAGTPVTARVLDGDLFSGQLSETSKTVAKLLGPLQPRNVPLVKCIGLNYIRHIEECKVARPPYPSVFYKPRTAVGDCNAPVPIPPLAQKDQVDYEGELCVVIGKTGKNIKAADALDHVLAYTVGNDILARTWQMDPAHAGGVPQWNFSKLFDNYAPLGPQLVRGIDSLNLKIETRVNGEVRQLSSTLDLLFSVAQIIEFLSQGTTLEQGTVIMTGTPEGVGMSFSPPKWLRDGDKVEVEIESIGTLVNEIKFE